MVVGLNKEELDALEEILNEELESCLDSGFGLKNERVVLVRNLLRKLGLKEYWDYDKKYGGE